MQLILFLVAFLVPYICGSTIIQYFAYDMPKHIKLLLSLIIGHSIFSMFIFILTFYLNIPFTVFLGITILLIFLIFNLLMKKRLPHAQTKETLLCKYTKLENFIFYILLIIMISYVIIIFIYGINSPLIVMPDMNLWGYKAKVIYLYQGIPKYLLTNASMEFTHRSYPLGFPIMIAWEYCAIGKVSEVFLKMIPTLGYILVLSSFYSISYFICSSKNYALLFTIIFGINATFFFCATIVYSETFFITLAMWGLFFLLQFLKSKEKRHLFLGSIFLASTAWIKNEGNIYFGIFILLILCFIKYKNTKDLFKTILIPLLSVIIFIAPWTFIKLYYKIPLYDFEITTNYKILSDNIVNIYIALQYTLKNIFINIEDNNGIGYILGFIICCNFKEIFTNKENLFLLMSLFLITSVFIGCFIFSIRPIEWHIRAIPRLLLINQFMVCYIFIKVHFHKN